MRKYSAAEINQLKQDLAKKIKIDQNQINFVTLNKGKTERFLYVFLPSIEDKPASFLKIADLDNKKRLKKESLTLALAIKLGLSELKITHTFQKINDRFYLFGREKLEPNEGIFLSPATVPKANAKLGRDAGRFLINFAGNKNIPNELKAISSRDCRNFSILRFWQLWRELSQSVLEENFLVDLVDWAKIDFFKKSIIETGHILKNLIKKPSKQERYFVHNDTAPSNLFFRSNGDHYDILLLDYEFAGATYHPILARITDLGNFYGWSWQNPKMQKEFLIGCLEEIANKPSEDYLIFKAAIILSTLDGINGYRNDPTSINKAMAKSLLNNFYNNIQFLDKTYKALSLVPQATIKEAVAN